MSPAQQAAFTQAIIEELGGDASKVLVLYTTADWSRCLLPKGKNLSSTAEVVQLWHFCLFYLQ